jgi:hypothetical protein
MPTNQGTIRLFEVKGITVFLHWTWFLVAAYEIGGRTGTYSSITWNVLEYRIRACNSVSKRRRPGESDRAVAARRHRLR